MKTGDAAAKFYPTLETASIYLCGLYPHDAWTIDATEGKTATCIFTGKEDVMAAPQQTTTKADSPNSFKTLDFQHLLTQLRIQFKAQNDEAANAWGEIASLKLLDKDGQPIGNKVTVNLKDGTSTGFAKDASGDLKFYQMSAKDKGTDAEYSQTGMTTTAAYKAYTLCPSVTADGAATAEYQLVITAAGGASETVNLNLKADNSADYGPGHRRQGLRYHTRVPGHRDQSPGKDRRLDRHGNYRSTRGRITAARRAGSPKYRYASPRPGGVESPLPVTKKGRRPVPPPLAAQAGNSSNNNIKYKKERHESQKIFPASRRGVAP